MKNSFNTVRLLLCVLLAGGMSSSAAYGQYPTFGKLIFQEPELKNLLDENAVIEVLAGGFVWTEGPVWLEKNQALLFSDVPKNTIFQWKEKEGVSIFLKPSGYTGLGEYSHEPGSNGLTIDPQGNLIACEHGDRRISSMSLEKGGKRTLSDSYQGKRLNSPNDVAIHPVSGEVYFTDPPYGLAKNADDPTREQPHFGVYRIRKNGETDLLVSDLTRPNGIAFSPDGKTMYVAVSDPQRAHIMAYSVRADGKTGPGKIFYDATPLVRQGLPGLPDGLKLDRQGNIWTTGPGGVLILNAQGKLLGRIDTGRPTANCAWGDDGSVLYITAQNYLCRIKTRTKGAGWK